MGRKITVLINGIEIITRRDTSISRVIAENEVPGVDGALGAIVNNRLHGLYQLLRSDCVVETVNYSSKEGANIYRRTLSLILCEAFAELYPQMRLEIGQALGGGYYYRVRTKNGELTEEILQTVEERMQEIVASDRPLRPTLVTAEEAKEYFIGSGYPEKSVLINQRNVAEVPWNVMGSFRDISYGPVAPRTGSCTKFKLLPKIPGFVLSFPNRKGILHKKLPAQEKLFNTYLETRRWNEMMGAWNVGQLNQSCTDGSVSDIIKVSEGLQEKRISRLSDTITADSDRLRLILIAGPSSSGKTTFTKRLAVQLRVNGIRPRMISLDNYYVNRVNTPKNPDGTYNYECLEALDVALFNEHLGALLKGEEVQSPIYNFHSGEREATKHIPLRLHRNEILIVEGIHGLNPKMSRAVPLENKYRIYVSALTQLAIDEQNRIFTSDIRLMRRIVRDRLFRGYSAAQTITQWPHVRNGENEYIFPFQEEADTMVDTALIYEPAVLKPYLSRFLREVSFNDRAYVDAYRLFQFLNLFIPIFPHEVPPTSILREFIGGSTFDY